MALAQGLGVMVDFRRTRPRRVRRIVVGACFVVGLATAAVAMGRAEPAAPTVEQQSVRIASVQRGEWVRDVTATGKLVPKQIRWVTAASRGRVDRVAVEPGVEVRAADLVVVLSNPELELQALESRSAEASARADLTRLKATLRTEELAERAQVATVQAEHTDAQRTAHADAKLADAQAIEREALERSRDKLVELRTRLDAETGKLAAQRRGGRAQLLAERERLHGLADVAKFRRTQVDDLQVRAGFSGVVQEVAVEDGQWVEPGTVLAKLADPTTLEAQLQVPEVQAKEIAVGQPVTVDTRGAIIVGHVTRVDPSVREGTVTVDVGLDAALPEGARPDLSVQGTIEIARVADVVHVERPVYAQPGRAAKVFKVTPDDHAVRVEVTFGSASAREIEITNGLAPGDRVVISDVAAWDDHDRIELK